MSDRDRDGLLESVSVIICCHNSEARLQATLDHLAEQITEPGIFGEVVVVDNGSTDRTGEVAKDLWPEGFAPLRVVREDQLGLSYARERGVREAKCEYLCFIDDDNWVNPGFIQKVHDIFETHPEVACCGGPSVPVFEADPPTWFEACQSPFACGKQAEGAGHLTDGYLWGAGLSVRKSAYLQLRACGFRSLLTDRRGTSLSSGGDTELVCALVLCGWKQWYDPKLGIKHYMPAARLSWSYLRRLCRAIGMSSVGIQHYLHSLNGPPKSVKEFAQRTWLWTVLSYTRQLMGYLPVVLKSRTDVLEGKQEILNVETCIGLLCGLLRQWAVYDLRTLRVWKRFGRAYWRVSFKHPSME